MPFDAVLELRFRNLQGYRKVRNKEYVLQEHATGREATRDRPWQSCFLSGQRYNMSLIFRESASNQAEAASCPRCHSVSDKSQDSDIQWYAECVQTSRLRLGVQLVLTSDEVLPAMCGIEESPRSMTSSLHLKYSPRRRGKQKSILEKVRLVGYSDQPRQRNGNAMLMKKIERMRSRISNLFDSFHRRIV